MVMWFALFANLVVSHLACTLHASMHGAHALIKYDTSKYLSGLACKQANSKLGKITASHFQVLNTQNANENMLNMFLIAYLNENLRYCNENSAWGKQEPFVHPYVFWYTTKVRKWQKLPFTLFTCRYHNF